MRISLQLKYCENPLLSKHRYYIMLLFWNSQRQKKQRNIVDEKCTQTRSHASLQNVTKLGWIMKGFFLQVSESIICSLCLRYNSCSACKIRAKCYICVFTSLIVRATNTPSLSKTLTSLLQNYMQYISEHSSFSFRPHVHLKTFLSVTTLPFNCLRSNRKANIQISEVLILR